MVMFITRFVVKGEAAQFERLFEEHARYMSSQPGYLGSQLVRSLGDPHTYLNIGRWRSPDDHRRVVASDQFQQHASQMRALVDVEAGFYEPVAGEG